MSMITIDLLIRNISMPIRADRGREEEEEGEEGEGITDHRITPCQS